MKHYLLFLFFSCAFVANAQDYSVIDNKIASYQKKFTDPQQLSALINKDFTLPADKARAIFCWIAINVRFDTEGKIPAGFVYKTEKERLAKEEKFYAEAAMAALQKGVATNAGYAALYNKLAALCGLESKIVKGVLKTSPDDIGKFGNGTSQWNAVKINDVWKLMDIALAAGYIDQDNKFVKNLNNTFFFSDPEQFFLNHFPVNIEMLLIKKTKEEFISLPLFYRDYFVSGLKLITPKKGIVLPQNGKITFTFKDADQMDAIGYMTENSNKVLALQQNEETLQYIAHVNAADNFISIIYMGKLMATFKITK